jgi:hypothetical protein
VTNKFSASAFESASLYKQDFEKSVNATHNLKIKAVDTQPTPKCPFIEA